MRPALAFLLLLLPLVLGVPADRSARLAARCGNDQACIKRQWKTYRRIRRRAAAAQPSATLGAFRSCPGTDQQGLNLIVQNATFGGATPQLYCAYYDDGAQAGPVTSCVYSETTGAIIQDNDGGQCRGSTTKTPAGQTSTDICPQTDQVGDTLGSIGPAQFFPTGYSCNYDDGGSCIYNTTNGALLHDNDFDVCYGSAPSNGTISGLCMVPVAQGNCL